MVNYFSNFPVAGFVKLVFGILLIVMGIIEKQTYISIIGGILLIATLANGGTCPGNVCTPTYRKRRDNN